MSPYTLHAKAPPCLGNKPSMPWWPTSISISATHCRVTEPLSAVFRHTDIRSSTEPNASIFAEIIQNNLFCNAKIKKT